MGKMADVYCDEGHVILWAGRDPTRGWRWTAVDLKIGEQVGISGGAAESQDDACRKAKEFVTEAARGEYEIVWTDTQNY